MTKIKRIFIANRGEIARRIASTAKKLGIESVALTDRRVAPAYLAGLVTEFIYIDEESTKVYLDISTMIDFAKSSGCDAIHPGFGFLSENGAFADAVQKAGLTWIGPCKSAIDAMASKATARQHAEAAAVPCLPGINGLDMSDEKLASELLQGFAKAHGFPILMKAAYGGGGKGMRIVQQMSELLDQAKRAASEALSSFGNASLIVEKYLPAPRHVEIQVLADKHGQVAILGDRDCSLQRRHQKILEEAPAPNIPADVRRSMHLAAKNLAAAVGYDNAGTVEFLFDQTNPQSPKFYFLEMNTRLQVEHTVTEEVFSVDLVEWQIKVARGETLDQSLLDASPRGHSIEVRIYAEDPGANFFPAPGPVRAFSPATGKGVRWELGLDCVDEITTAFDPMISKLVCTAGDRSQALELVAQTLERTQFSGPRNNIPFLIWLVRHPQVVSNPVDTHFIAQHVQSALDHEALERKSLEPFVNELMDAMEGRRPLQVADHHLVTGSGPGADSRISTTTLTRSVFSKADAKPFAQRLLPNLDLRMISKHISFDPQRPQLVSRFGVGLFSHVHQSSQLFHYTLFQSANAMECWIGIKGHNWVRVQERVTLSSGDSSQGNQNQSTDGMVAPVPGKVVAVFAQPGRAAVKGDVLFILESMKMQFEVKSSREATVSHVHVAVGDQVKAGQHLGQWSDAK